MDHKKKVIEWILSNKEKLSLDITYCTWPKKWNLNIHDFRVEITIDRKKCIGRGTDCNEETALVKAVVEALERSTCFKEGIRSNGVAAHFNMKNAIENSRNELIERDLFFCHFLTKTSPINLDSNVLSSSIINLKKKLSIEGINISFKKLNDSFEGPEVIMCIVDGINYKDAFGVIIGLGTSKLLSNAIKTAFYEALRNLSAILDGDIDLISPINFRLININTLRHIEYAARYENFENYKFLKNNNTSQRVKLSKIHIKSISLDTSHLKLPFPFSVIRSTSHNLQDAFWGQTKDEFINTSRLIDFFGSKKIIERLNNDIHPLG